MYFRRWAISCSTTLDFSKCWKQILWKIKATDKRKSWSKIWTDSAHRIGMTFLCQSSSWFLGRLFRYERTFEKVKFIGMAWNRDRIENAARCENVTGCNISKTEMLSGSLQLKELADCSSLSYLSRTHLESLTTNALGKQLDCSLTKLSKHLLVTMPDRRQSIASSDSL